MHRSPKIDVPLLERAALNPNEFAAVFGKQNPWGYRQIYAGRVKILPGLGRMLIPQSEVRRLMSEAVLYVGTDGSGRSKHGAKLKNSSQPQVTDRSQAA